MVKAMATNCKATVKATGKRCTAAAGADGYCYMHTSDPAIAAQRNAARKRGGQFKRAAVTSEPVKVQTVADVLALVNAVIRDSWYLENSPARARVLLSAAEEATKSLQIGQLEERVRALEAAKAGEAG